jgi:NADH-quinone oxidoreductase subunit F
LGDAAAWPVASAIRHFRDEFEWHIQHPLEATKAGAIYIGAVLG